MAIIDVVKWDGSPDIFAWKFPEENLTTFTQLIVNESQEAVFFHKGAIIAVFGPGKHVLSTENIPILEKLYGIPFGGKNPFTAEVWFVNKVKVLDIKWGTNPPFQIRDPQYRVFVPVRAFGQFGIQITDAKSFLVKLVGTVPAFRQEDISSYFKGLLMAESTSIIAKKITEDKVCVLDIATQILPLSKALKENIQQEFAEYGITLVNFYINSISIPEGDPAVSQLKTLLSRKAEMEVLGFTYQQERAYNVLENAAGNQGTVGNTMGAGIGMGMGLGVGGIMGGMMQEVGHQVRGESAVCPHCKKTIPAGVNFCPVCGKKITSSGATVSTVICNNCQKEMPATSKYCPHCGDIYNACPECKTDNPTNATQCVNCGCLMPIHCPKCNAKVNRDARFCPECGERIAQICPKCNQAVNPGSKFCPSCGENLSR